MNSSSSAMIFVLLLLLLEATTSASTNSASSTGAVEESAEGDDDVEVPIPPKPARDDGNLVANAKVSGGDERAHTRPMRASGASRQTTDIFVPARMIDRLEAAAPVAAFFVGIVRSSWHAFESRESGDNDHEMTYQKPINQH